MVGWGMVAEDRKGILATFRKGERIKAWQCQRYWYRLRTTLAAREVINLNLVVREWVFASAIESACSAVGRRVMIEAQAALCGEAAQLVGYETLPIGGSLAPVVTGLANEGEA